MESNDSKSVNNNNKSQLNIEELLNNDVLSVNNEQKTDKTDELNGFVSIARKVVHFLQSLDGWVYHQQELGNERPEPYSLDEVDDFAVNFAKSMQSREK